MKSLLVGIEAAEPPGSWYVNLARAAGLIAGAFDAHVEVVGIEHPDLRAPVMLEGDWSVVETLRRQATENAGEIFQRVFASGHFCTKAQWAGVLRAEALGAHARLFDLTLLARPERSVEGPSRAPAESVLFESGRPLLLVPDWDGPIGTTVVISWIDTPETARAVQFAMPLLKRAEQVYLLTIKDGRVSGSQAHGIAAGLARHGVDAQVRELATGASVAHTTLKFATDVHADLLVKGAYTETRLQRFIFGDTTDHLISNARLPLFLAH